MTELIRVGIVGAGGNTRRKHIPKLLNQEGVEVTVVCNRSRESSQSVAEEFGIPRVADHWKDVVADPDLDAIVIGTWPYLHAPISIAALEAGKHVLCEARMAMNLTEAVAMLEASHAHPELVAQVVPSPFTLTWDTCLKRILETGEIGKLLAVDVFANSGSFVDPERSLTWREQRIYSGLNTMMLGIYYEAMVRWTGHVETVEARARIFVEQRTDSEGNSDEIEIPDHLDVFGELQNGASYHIRCSQVTGACPTPNEFILYGTNGSIRLDLVSERCTLHRPDGSTETLTPREEEAGSWRVEEEFINAIRGKESIKLTTFEEGVRYMAFTQRALESAGMA